MLDDHPAVLEMMESVIRVSVENVAIFPFTHADLAYRQLMRYPPDLFTTDINHGGMSVQDILASLTQSKVTYPIFVISAFADRSKKRVEKKLWA